MVTVGKVRDLGWLVLDAREQVLQVAAAALAVGEKRAEIIDSTPLAGIYVAFLLGAEQGIAAGLCKQPLKLAIVGFGLPVIHVVAPVGLAYIRCTDPLGQKFRTVVQITCRHNLDNSSGMRSFAY